MGCGASSPPLSAAKYEVPADTQSNRSTHTVTLTSNNLKFVGPNVKIPTRNIQDDDDGDVTISPVAQRHSESPVPRFEAEFVFGDFKVEKSDVLRQRIERLNRVRRDKKDVRRCVETPFFVINDFRVKTIDETDSSHDGPAYCYFNEQPVPPGFVQLKGFTIKPLKGHMSRVKTMVVCPQGNEYVSASVDDSDIALHSLRNGQDLRSFTGHTGSIISASFSHDGLMLATSARDDTAVVWDVSHNNERGEKMLHQFDHGAIPICCTFSFDGLFLVTGCQDKQCIIWDLENGKQREAYTEHSAMVVSMASHPNQYIIASGGGDRVVRLWDCTTLETVRKLTGHNGVVISLNFNYSGTRLLSNDDRLCRIWKTDDGTCLRCVALESLVQSVSDSVNNHSPPVPLTCEYPAFPMAADGRAAMEKGAEVGRCNNSIISPTAVNVSLIAMQKTVFTLSCLLPGPLVDSYFAVACTNRNVYIISTATGQEELSFQTRGAVFALSPAKDALIFGDIFGNVYKVSLRYDGSL